MDMDALITMCCFCEFKPQRIAGWVMVAASKRKEKNISESCASMNVMDSDAKIAEIAYYKSQSRDFEPGHELDDWLEAEREFKQCGCD